MLWGMRVHWIPWVMMRLNLPGHSYQIEEEGFENNIKRSYIELWSFQHCPIRAPGSWLLDLQIGSLIYSTIDPLCLCRTANVAYRPPVTFTFFPLPFCLGQTRTQWVTVCSDLLTQGNGLWSTQADPACSMQNWKSQGQDVATILGWCWKRLLRRSSCKCWLRPMNWDVAVSCSVRLACVKIAKVSARWSRVLTHQYLWFISDEDRGVEGTGIVDLSMASKAISAVKNTLSKIKAPWKVILHLSYHFLNHQSALISQNMYRLGHLARHRESPSTNLVDAICISSRPRMLSSYLPSSTVNLLQPFSEFPRVLEQQRF